MPPPPSKDAIKIALPAQPLRMREPPSRVASALIAAKSDVLAPPEGAHFESFSNFQGRPVCRL